MPVHFDHNYAPQTEFGKPLVDSIFTLALVTGQSVTNVSQNVFANLGWDEVWMPSPIFEGGTTSSSSEVFERILEGERGMAAGMPSHADPEKLVEGLGEGWAVPGTSFKYHAYCRHTYPAADALLDGMEGHGLGPGDVARVRTRVHAAATDVLGPVSVPRTVHQSKSSMGFVRDLLAEGSA
jgi:hypothetical protein